MIKKSASLWLPHYQAVDQDKITDEESDPVEVSQTPKLLCCIYRKRNIHQYVKMTLDKHIIFCKHVYIHVHVHFVIFCVN